MAVKVARSWRAVVIGGLAALVALPVLGGSAGAVAPRTPTIYAETEWVVMHFAGSGPIKGIVTIESGAPGRVRYAFHGLPATGELRAVASTKPCSQPHVGSAKILGWSLGASNPTSTAAIGPGGTAAGQFMVEISGVNAGYIRSLRVFRGAGTGDQRACSKTTHWSSQAAALQYKLSDVLVSSYFKGQQRGGIILTGTRSDGKVQVRASLTGLRGGTAYRIVGSTAACGTAHTGSKRVYAVPFTTLGDTATHEVGHWVSAVTDADRPTSALRSIRVIKNFGAGNQVEACHGIIAILIGL